MFSNRYPQMREMSYGSLEPTGVSHLMETYKRQQVAFEMGIGANLWDSRGQMYLDAISGVAVTNLGHANSEIAHAISEQALLLLHTSNMFSISWQEKLAERLCGLAGLTNAFFCNSGAEANESALKLARLHGKRRGVLNPHVVVMENSFHGRTLATLAATGNPAVQKGFEPLLSGFTRVPYADIDAVHDASVTNPDIVAVLVEPVQGEGGVRIADAQYLRELRMLCDENNWLLMVDEVQTGMCRTGRWFGFQHADITPDVMTLAKGLGNGFPIGACLAGGRAADLFMPGTHGSTFGGNPLACRVGCTVVDIMERDAVAQKAEASGRYLLDALNRALASHPEVVAVRGHGLMAGIDLRKNCSELVALALEQEHLLITVTREKTIRLLPPLICTHGQLDDIVNRLARVLNSWAGLNSATAAQAT